MQRKGDKIWFSISLLYNMKLVLSDLASILSDLGIIHGCSYIIFTWRNVLLTKKNLTLWYDPIALLVHTHTYTHKHRHKHKHTRTLMVSFPLEQNCLVEGKKRTKQLVSYLILYTYCITRSNHSCCASSFKNRLLLLLWWWWCSLKDKEGGR